MNNVYFSNEGMTSTTANYYANIAKELQNAATERLNSVKFFNTSVAVIGSAERQLMSKGIGTLAFIEDDLQELATLNAFCAWVREAIKEKDAQLSKVTTTSIEAWAINQGIELPESPTAPRDPGVIPESMIINSWDINKRNKYLRLEAFAATFGKYIHPDGAYSNARKSAHQALNKPITSQGAGRDMVLYYTEESVSINDVDTLFLSLQDQYRAYEKELNQMKAEIKDEVNEATRIAYDEYLLKVDEYHKLSREYNTTWNTLRAQFLKWRTDESERISKLKITVPSTLKGIFNRIKSIGDTSK